VRIVSKLVCVKLFGKPTGCVARVDIGQIIFSVRAKDANQKQVVEALRRAKYKFPGRQNIIVSNRWGFTPYTRDQYQKYLEQGRLLDRGSHVKVNMGHGKLNPDNAILIR